MTIQEAKQRWCPFSTARDPGARVGVNRLGDGEMHFACQCLADKCMAWRHYEQDPRSGWCGRVGKESL